MQQFRSIAVAFIAVAATSLSLAGCSSDDGSGKKTADTPTAGTAVRVTADATAAEPSDAGRGSAHLTYSGGDSGEFTIKSVGCTVVEGKLTAITAPDVNDAKASTPPAFTAGITSDGAMATLVTPGKKTYVHIAASGITSRKTGGTWVATVAGMKLGPTDGAGDSITVDGTITCGKVAGS
ncbi:MULTISPECIES: hypothetical protein [Streptomyces]|uniref:hypothetical protein n=1 Tax=Streptomyces TaxID=1883 RepID=UPI000A589927|nr:MULTISPECIES: hypothetical protein [Streptomyces]